MFKKIQWQHFFPEKKNIPDLTMNCLSLGFFLWKKEAVIKTVYSGKPILKRYHAVDFLSSIFFHSSFQLTCIHYLYRPKWHICLLI